MGDAPGPGWWLASDGRYYPPESAPGPAVGVAPGPVPPTAPAAAPEAQPPGPRRPFYRRAWFWVVIGLAVLAIAIIVAVIWFISSMLSAGDESSGSGGPVTVESADYATEPDGPVESTDAWSASVADGVLMLRANQPGAVYPSWTRVDPASEMTVTSTMRWPDGVDATGELAIGGVMVVSPQGDGYGLGCGTDGNMYFLSVGVEQTESLEITPNEGCDDEFTLSIDASAGDTTDIIGLGLPDGESTVWTPGTTLGSFTEAGFMLLPADQASTAPPLDVTSYEVTVGSPEDG